MPNVLAVIPARGGSKEIPRKNIFQNKFGNFCIAHFLDIRRARQ